MTVVTTRTTPPPRTTHWTDDDDKALLQKVKDDYSKRPNRKPGKHIPWSIKETVVTVIKQQKLIGCNDWCYVSRFLPDRTRICVRSKCQWLKRNTNFLDGEDIVTRKKRAWTPTLIIPAVTAPLVLANLPMDFQLQDLLKIPELYKAVVPPVAIKLLCKYGHLLYQDNLPLGSLTVPNIWTAIWQVKILSGPLTKIDHAKANGIHFYFGVSAQVDIRARCVNFLAPAAIKKDGVSRIVTPKLINVKTKQNLSPRDSQTICGTESYVLVASPYKPCVLQLEDHCIRKYKGTHHHLCLNHGTSPIGYLSSPPSEKELKNLDDSITVTDVSTTATGIYRLYLTILHTESAIKDKKVIVGSTPEAQRYLPIQKVDLSGAQHVQPDRNFDVEQARATNICYPQIKMIRG